MSVSVVFFFCFCFVGDITFGDVQLGQLGLWSTRLRVSSACLIWSGTTHSVFIKSRRKNNYNLDVE